ncbi:hypothetical protein BV20DRAFT_488223 [Pilatotrama ljubarskyi]|nr:hypothetical protein BV20DRAFT_488223 [Pilatotrama ljubarskyi]
MTAKPSVHYVPQSPAHEWVLVESSPGASRTFSRPLGPTEIGFYYDRLFNGTADIVWQYAVELAGPSESPGPALFSYENVARTWSTLKEYYPLLGSRMEPQDDGTVRFVVEERALSRHREEEVTVATVSSAVEVEAIGWRCVRDDPTEHNHITSRVFVLARAEKPGTYDVLFKAAHAISDGVAGATLARTFFDVLCSPPIQVSPLEERLAMALPLDALNPSLKMSVAGQRWRRAIGAVTFHNMRRKLVGGHAIPRTVTDETYRTPAVTRRAFIRFDVSESRTMLDSCRRHKVTFGSVIPVLSQMALTRFLHRRYLRGDMSEDEWEHRRRQPTHYGGPLNLRPHLDEEWQRKGGTSEISLMIDYYDCTLPFMPAPFGKLKDASVPCVHGAPPYAALLSRARFFYRAGLVGTQLARILKHPLLPEIARARQPWFLQRRLRMVTHWQAASKGEPLPEWPQLDAASSDCCFAGAVSSSGDTTSILPWEYPLQSPHPLSIRTLASPAKLKLGLEGGALRTKESPCTQPSANARDRSLPKLRLADNSTFLHSRPAEFFLSNATKRNRIEMTLTYDANVYREEDAEEYLQECRDAALYYLAASGGA